MEVLTEDHEPSLGQEGTWTDAGIMYDLEEDKADEEPALGATEAFNQECAWKGVDLSLSDGEGEPYLGWAEHHGRGVIPGENFQDREVEFEDEGAQCDDEGVIEGDTFI
ncbi:hypothetical protein ABUE31_08020 [Mesorhizobium sp. ZMM04-5]|uniref:Uncharacterized protein n=2 Tax=Mesorhizobium marinum TaxID=3228790 RepID=A0ABV3QXZ0_9HYPH